MQSQNLPCPFGSQCQARSCVLRLFAETFESAAMLLLLPAQNTGLLPAGAAAAAQQKVLTIDTASSSSAIIEVINPGFWSPSDSSSLICLLISSSLAGRLAGRLAGSVMSRSASCTDAHRGLPACGQRELSARLSRRCLLESSG